jgi:hypothetical protein
MKSVMITAVALAFTTVLSAVEMPAAKAPLNCASFLFIRPAIRAYYVAGPGGMLVPSAEPPDLMPPKDIYIRNGKDYKHVYTNENVISDPVFSNGPSMTFSDVYVEAPHIPSTTVTASTSKRTGVNKEKDKPAYLKLASLSEGVNSGTWLICMFKQDSAKTWSPPKILEVPTDEVRFPLLKTLVINTSRLVVGVEGASGKLIPIAPGDYGIIALPKLPDGDFAVKAAYVKGGKPFVLCNTNRSASPTTRLVFVFNDNPNSDGRPDVGWFVAKFEKEALPPEEKPAPIKDKTRT